MKIGDKVLVTAAHKVGWREMKKRGIMANSNPQMVDTNVERVVDLAILTADTLIAKCEKGGE